MRRKELSWLLFTIILASCYKKEIEFGQEPQNSYTRLVYVDTIAVKMSTVISDSFATNGATSMLLGKYKDPYLGIISARPFFQLNNMLTSVDVPVTAVFDSLVFIIRPNEYYYGDTTHTQTIYVHELSQSIAYSYNDKLYNTSDVAVKPVPLGSKTTRISPVKDDSILVRLSDTKGQELFDKIKDRSADLTNSDQFLNYFKGIRLSVADNDTTAIYGMEATGLVVRVYYHHTTPSVESKSIDLTVNTNSYAFNQVLSNRSGTLLPASTSSLTEIASEQTGNVSFSQYGTGLLLKMTFPSLRDLIKNDDVVKLMKADLVIRPASLSFDNKLKLPALQLNLTDGSNIMGDIIEDSTASAQYRSAFVDAIYGENTHYRFNVTSYINQLLNTPGSEDYGFYLIENISTSAMHVNRVVVNDANRVAYKTQLALSLLVIDK